MGKAIGKILLIAVCLILFPILMIALSVVGCVAPFIGFLMIILFPIILIGIIIGYRSGKKKGQQAG